MDEDETLRQAIRSFIGHGKDVTDAKLADFLSTTSKTGLSRSRRLIQLMFAAGLDWPQTCQFVEFMLREEPIQDQIGIYIIWLAAAQHYWILEKGGLSVEQRARVADDVEAILERALAVSPHNSGLAAQFGIFFAKHPLRPQQNPVYLERAMNWFQTAAQWAQDNEDEENAFEAAKGIANCYFDLGQWENALVEYEKLNLELMQEQERDSEFMELQRRFHFCRQQTSEL